MVYIIKETLDVDINHIFQFHCKREESEPAYCMMSVAVWSKPIAMLMKLRFAYRLHYLKNTLLY